MSYFIEHIDLFSNAFFQHLQIVVLTLLISIVLAGLICLVLLKFPKVSNICIQFFSAIYSIPSLALFAILIPLTGLGRGTAILVLVLYNQYLLVRNIMTGMTQVDPAILEAATGMGMTHLQIVRRVQIPLAAPMIVAGIKLAIVSTTGIATIAATINAGGLGSLLFSGMRTMNVPKIAFATILCMLIAELANVLLGAVEKRLKRGPLVS